MRPRNESRVPAAIRRPAAFRFQKATPAMKFTRPIAGGAVSNSPAAVLLPALLAALACLPAAAQTLTVNGHPGHVPVPVDSFVEVELCGPPGAVHYWAFDTDPGPTQAGPLSIPLGFSANLLDIGMGLPMPASGCRSIAFAVAGPSLAGLAIYTAGAFVDGQGAVALTNGAGFTVTPKGASAGPDGVALAGRPAALDGTRMLDGGGALLPGIQPLWSIVHAPAGSNPQLTGIQDAIPEFVADLPGRYTIRVETPAAGGLSQDECHMDIFAVDLASLPDGQFIQGSAVIQGTVDGPYPPSGLQINGVAAALAGNSFHAGTQPLVDPLHPFTVRIQLPGGGVLEHTATAINNDGVPVGAHADVGGALRLSGVDLSFIEAPIELLLSAVPLNSVITAIPPLPLINSPPFLTANFAFTSASYDPNVDVSLIPATGGGIGIALTFTNLTITADVTGVIFGVPYNEMATISAASATTTTQIVVSSNAAGVTSVSTQNTATTFQNFQFAVTGVLGGLTQLGTIQAGAQAAIELALNGLMALIPQALNPLLASFASNADLSPLGIPVVVGLPVAGVNYDAAGLTVANRVAVTPLLQGAESPAIARVFATPGAIPQFSAVTPVGSAPFAFAQSINDDLLNQYFAALTAAGVLDFTWDSAGGQPLTAGDLLPLLPGTGIERMSASAAARVLVRHTVAPVLTFGGSPGDATLWLSNLQIAVQAEASPGRFATIARFGGSGRTDLSFAADPQTGAPVVIPGTPSISTTRCGAFPGYDGAAAMPGIAGLLENLVPLLLSPLGSLPLPGAGLATGIAIESGLHPGAPDTYTIYL